MEKPSIEIFAKALSAMLKDNEGIVVHLEETGYIIYNEINETDGKIVVLQNDEYLGYPDLQLIWMHDEPVDAETGEPVQVH